MSVLRIRRDCVQIRTILRTKIKQAIFLAVVNFSYTMFLHFDTVFNNNVAQKKEQVLKWNNSLVVSHLNTFRLNQHSHSDWCNNLDCVILVFQTANWSNFQTHIIKNSNSFKKIYKRNSYLLSVCAFFAVHSRVLNSHFLGKSHTDLSDVSL